MAKEDKGSDDYEFEVPDFDEDAFIHKELVSFKTTGVLFAWGIVSALVSWGLWEATGANKTGWYLGIGIMVAFAYLLRFVYKALKIDISHFGRREWFGTFFLLFFAWLSFFILFINPPISDHADPTAAVFAAPSIQQEGGDVNLALFAADNLRVDHVEFLLQQGARTIATEDDLTVAGDGYWTYSLPAVAAGEYTYTFTVEDSRDNSASVEGKVTVKRQAVKVGLPDDGRLSSLSGEVRVVVDDLKPCAGGQIRDGGNCLRTVYLDLDNGQKVHLQWDEANTRWEASSSFTGWSEGTNTFRVVAEQSNQFQGHHTIEGGNLVLPGPFNVTVEGTVGDYEPKVIPEVTDPPITRQTPGFEALVVVGVLAAFAFAARRKQE